MITGIAIDITADIDMNIDMLSMLPGTKNILRIGQNSNYKGTIRKQGMSRPEIGCLKNNQKWISNNNVLPGI